MHILVINGPNLNLLGTREPEHYGTSTYADLVQLISDTAKKLGITAECYQSNHEGALVDKIQSALGTADAIVMNPAAYTHTSVAILDAVKAVQIPTIEVHITDPDTREEFRRISYVRAACVKTIKGMGLAGYAMAMEELVRMLRK